MPTLPKEISADIITDTSARVIMTADERTKLADLEPVIDTGWINFRSAFTDILDSNFHSSYRRKGDYLFLFFRGQFSNNVSEGRSYKLFNVKDIGITLSTEANTAFNAAYYGFKCFINQTSMIEFRQWAGGDFYLYIGSNITARTSFLISEAIPIF